MAEPVKTSATSPSSLPIRGYTIDQLADYITRQLGGGIFSVELTRQQIIDQVNDALAHYSQYRPRVRYGAIQLTQGVHRYLEGCAYAFGVVDVAFVNPFPIPSNLYWGNLINPGPLVGAGIDEYDSYLRWQKTWQRVTSAAPDWLYDEAERVLYIHNAMDHHQAGVVAMDVWDRTERLDQIGATWVKDYAFQRARLQLAEILSKFSGAIPGPVANLQLDQAKRDKAETRIKELEDKLFGMQWSVAAFSD